MKVTGVVVVLERQCPKAAHQVEVSPAKYVGWLKGQRSSPVRAGKVAKVSSWASCSILAVGLNLVWEVGADIYKI